MRLRPLSLLVPATCLLASANAWAAPDFTEMVAMRDSVHLATDVYLPEGGGKYPVVLHRTPYTKESFADAGENLRTSGVATVAQDMRGRYSSEGVDCIFRCDGDGELQDGYDTIEWIRGQSWSNGIVFTFGGSATGIVQYMAATAAPEGLAAMWVIVASPKVYDGLFFQGGVFHQNLVEGWLQSQGSSFFLDDVKAHPTRDSFWTPVETSDRFSKVNVPAVHVGGWYDIMTQGTIDAFVGYQHQGGAGAKGKQKLIMGPWTHGGQNLTTQGELTYPDQAMDIPGGSDNMLMTWLAHYLGVAKNQAAIDAMPAVQYYVMGAVGETGAPGNEWRTADDWPIAAAPIRLHLQPGNTLAESCPPSGASPASYAYDPASPSPTLGGGNLILPAGPYDQAEVEKRADVLVYSTEALSVGTEITGRIRAHLFVDIDTPDTDLMVRLTDVYPDGRSMLLTDGATRVALRNGLETLQPATAGDVMEVTVDLWSTSIILAPGHKLRISVTSSNSPRFWASPNDGTSYGGNATAQVTHVRLHQSLEHASYLEVSMPARDESEVVQCSAEGPDAGEPGPEASVDAMPESSADGPKDSPTEAPEDSGEPEAGTEEPPAAPADNDSGGCSCAVTGRRGAGPLLFGRLWSSRTAKQVD